MTQTNPTSSSNNQRIALAIEYDGEAFSGWQKQASPELPTVQGALEQALSQVADMTIRIVCAGRTDAGVHASCQIAHFDTPVDRGDKAWVMGVNSLLPRSVRVLWSKQVGEEFNARFSATARRYYYVLHVAKIASAILKDKVSHSYQQLDYLAMHEAAQALVGEQDFTSFRAAGCQSTSPNRCIQHAHFLKQGPFLIFDIKANAFLQHMVRNIVGSLLEIGRGEQAVTWIADLLAAKDRALAGVTAPPDGLYLVAVDYPEKHALPVTARLPVFLEPGLV